jgi:hypothetical protein
VAKTMSQKTKKGREIAKQRLITDKSNRNKYLSDLESSLSLDRWCLADELSIW